MIRYIVSLPILAVCTTTIAQPVASNWSHDGANGFRNGRSGFPAATDNALQWSLQLPTGKAPQRANVVINSEGVLYVGNYSREDGRGVHAVSSEGNVLWHNDSITRVNGSGAVLADDSVVILSRGHAVHRISHNGVELWTVNPDVNSARDFFTSPLLDENGNIYACRQNSGMFALDSSGNVLWNASPTLNANVSPAMLPSGSIVYSGNDGVLRMVDRDGVEQWTFNTGDTLNHSSPAIGDDGTIYIGTLNEGLYAISADGSLLWHKPNIDGVNGRPAISSDGNIIVSGRNSTLWVLNTDGDVLWNFSAGLSTNWVYSSPVVDSDGNIYASLDTSTLFAFRDNGVALFAYIADSPITCQPALAANGTIYFTTTGATLYAVGTPLPCLADFSGDGNLDFFDVSAFLIYYQLGDLTADMNGDGSLDFFDVSEFLTLFVAGCP